MFLCCDLLFFSRRRRHTRCALVTGVQTCALPISEGWAHKSRLDLVQIARQTSTVLSRQPPSKVPARQPKDKQRLSSVHLLGNCGFKEQQEEAAKRHGCHTGERAGSGIGEARIEQINACKTEDRRKQRIEWHTEGQLRAGIAGSEEHTSELQSLMRTSYAAS